jgi:streptogramin lyase
MEKLQRSIGSHAQLSRGWRMSTSFQTFLVCLLFALWGTGNLYSQADPSAGCTRTFTSDEDFNEGLLLSVNTSVSGSLRLDQPGQPLPFVYIPCSARGTVVRINVVTGEIVGEFASAPDGRGKDPSRTTVDKFGNVWVSNRGESSSINGTPKGSVIRIGLTLGGTRCDADGTPNALGQYLKPPFIYNTCIDRNGDGLIKTSRGLGNILPWTNAGGVDNDGGVDTAEDEAITVYTRVLATGARTIAVDGSPEGEFNVWVGGSSNNFHEKLDGETGEPIAGSAFNTGTGGYGGLFDGNGVLWSATGGNGPILRYDTNTDTYINISGNGDYGLGIDPNTGEIWATNVNGNRVVKMSPSGAILGSYQHGSFNAQGVGVDAFGNVYVAHSLINATTTIGHLKTDGTFVGNIQLGPAGAGPIGIAIDAFGKVWTSGIYGNTAQRIDPNAGPIGANGEPIGAVDLTVDLGAGAGPYTYSDMTGFVAINATVPSGTWNVVHDGLVAGRKWGKITWTADTPQQTGVIVEARASDDLLNLALLDYVQVGNGEEFCCAGVTGRYVEIRTTLFRGITINETPVLYDLTVECCEIYPNEVPTIASSRNCNPTDTLTLPADQPFTMSLFGNDADADQALTISSTALPAGATLVQNPGSSNPVSAEFSWTPTEAQVGIYNITFQVDDIYCYNDQCPKVLEVIPCVPFSIYGVDSLITVQCLEDKPGFQEGVYAYDECTGFYGEIETWESETGSPEGICEAITALGPGADWSVWLPSLAESGDAASAYFNFDSNGGTFEQYTDGTAHLSGTVQNNLNANQKFVVDFWFENKADWTQWNDVLGRNYKNDLLLPCAVANHEDWTYYEMKGGFSTLTGAGELAGDVLYMYHTPASYYFGFQIGEGANNKNCNHGMSGWFSYDGFVNGEHVDGHGDVNVDTECDTLLNPGDCIHNTSFTYFYRSENENGFALIATQQIVIEDTTAPEFVDCPEAIAIECDQEIPAVATPSAVDNCAGDVTVEFLGEIVEGDACYSTITRTWSATDLCGNRTDCVQVITIIDTTAPEMGNLPEGEITVECDAVPAAADVTLVDNCDENPTLVYNEERIDGNCPNNYTLVRTWFGYDQCQNETSVYTQTIHVEDTTAPVFDAYEYYAHIECDQIPDTIPATDNCGGVNVEVIQEIHQSGGCLGVLHRIYRATDLCGNTTDAEQFIAILDTTAPEFVGLPSDLNLECSDVTLNDNGGVTGSDNCNGEVTIEYSEEIVETDDNCVNSYDIIRTWVATDFCGNTTTAIRTTHVDDTTAPEFVEFPADETISCEDAIPAVQMPIAIDNCADSVSIEYADEIIEGACPQSYTIVRTFRANDGCGNETVQSQYITVIDETAPVFAEQAGSFTYECNTEIPVVTPVASDNCGAVTLEYINSDIQGTSCESFFTRIWTATDECGNASEFTQYITIVDTTAPTVNSFVVEIEMPCDEVSNAVLITAEDNCSEVNITFTDEHVSGGCAGKIIRTYSVSDVCGNVNSGLIQQIITLIDVTAPSVEVAPADVQIECGEQVPSYSPIWSDNCANNEDLTLSNTQEITEDPCTTVIYQSWTAVDPCGNSTTVSRTISIVDSTAPVFTYAPSNEERDCNADDVVATAYADDNCSDVTISHNDVIVPGLCPASYTIERTYTATDVCGNFTIYTQIINVSDNNGPVWGENQTSFVYECGSDADVVTPVASDDCSEFTMSYADGASMALGCTSAFERTWLAVDACGNASAPFVQYISFEDTTEPVLNGCPSDLVLACEDAVPAAAEVTAIDGCDSDVQVYYNEVILGDAPAEGSIADCNLITPARAAGNPCGYPYDWAMAMFNMPAAHRWYQVVDGSLVQYEGGSLHLVAQLENVLTPGTGWNVDVWFNGGMDWAAWSTQGFPTSFKADCGGVNANFASWTYFLLQAGPGAELNGYGNYEGSSLNLVHAPSNNYFGYQLGDGANNYNAADNAFGGWFSYSGSFRANADQNFSNISGAGDFAFELDCCPDYEIVRQWTAVDCSGNTSTCTQHISFSASAASNDDNDGQSTINTEAVSNERTSTIAVAPNPANSNALFTFKAAYAAKTSIEVFDLTGKKVADVFMGTVEAGASYNVSFNVSDLATGVYTYRLTNGSDVKIDRLIINK